MTKYNSVDGVPKSHFYLVEIVTFGDFEVEQVEKIIYTSQFKNELVDYCRTNNLACRETNTGNSWNTHYILQNLN